MAIDKKSSPIVIPIKADTSPFKKSLKDLEKSTKAWTDLLNGDKTKSTANRNIKNLDDTRRASDNLYSSIKKHQDVNVFDTNTKGASNLGSVITNSIVPMKMMQQNMGGLINKVERMLPSLLMLNYGIKNVISESFQANQKTIEWHNSLSTLSDTSGNANAAIGQMTKGFFASAGSLEQVKGNMLSLVNEGISPTSKGFNELTRFVTNMSIATGIGAETFTNFSGILIRNWGSSVRATEQMTSSVIAMQKAFGSTASEMTATMKTIGDVMEKMGSFFSDGERSAIALTKGISMAVGVMNKLGVSTQKSTEFMGKLLDPDQLSENLQTFHRLGVSTQEVFDMFTSADPKAMVFDKILDKLPELSKQIMSIQNPLARINFAKSVGIDLAIASKMAKATGGQVDKIRQEFKKAADDTKAAEKKQSQMKAEAQKFDDTLHLMKRDALEPMMKWVHENMGLFWTTAKYVFAGFKKYTTGMAGILDTIKTAFLPAFDVLTNGGGFGDFLSRLTDGVLTIFGKAVVKLWDTFIEYTPAIAKGVASAWTTMMKDHPVITSLITVATGMTMYNKVVGGIRDFVTAFKGERGTYANPMITQEFGSLGGKGGLVKDILTKGKTEALIFAKVAWDVLSKKFSFLGWLNPKTYMGMGKTMGLPATKAAGTGLGALAGKTAGVTGKVVGKAFVPITAGLGVFNGISGANKYEGSSLFDDRRKKSEEMLGLEKKYRENGGLGAKDATALAKLMEERKTSREDSYKNDPEQDRKRQLAIEAGTLSSITFGLISKKTVAQWLWNSSEEGKKEKEQFDKRIDAEHKIKNVNFMKNLIANAKKGVEIKKKEDAMHMKSFENRILSGKKLSADEMKLYEKLGKERRDLIGSEHKEIKKSFAEIQEYSSNSVYGFLGKMGVGLGIFDNVSEATTSIGVKFNSILLQWKDFTSQIGLWVEKMKESINPKSFFKGSEQLKKDMFWNLGSTDIDFDVKGSSAKALEKVYLDTIKWNAETYNKMSKDDKDAIKRSYSDRLKIAEDFDKRKATIAAGKLKGELEEKEKRRQDLYIQNDKLLKNTESINKFSKITAGNTKQKPEEKTKDSTNWFDAFVGYNTAIKVTM